MIVLPAPAHPRAGASVIDEIDGALGVLLAQRLRDVLLWAAADERAALFRAPRPATIEWTARATLQEDGIAAAVVVLGRLVLFPHAAVAGEISIACTTIAEWAEGRGRLWTALDFSEAAALVRPADAMLSVRCGILCRRLALANRGSQWFLRAIGQARRSGESRVYIEGQLGYGTLLFALGNYPRAKPHFLKAARVAAQKKLWKQAAKAYHDLLCLSTDAGTLEEGDEYARRALDYYPARNPRIPHLVYDYAYALVRRQHFTFARPLLAAAVGFFSRPSEKLLCTAVFARTCAALGFRDSYDAAIATVLQLSVLTEESAAAALLHAAAAARIAGDWDLAERIAAQGLDLAIRRGEGGAHSALLQLLDEVAIRECTDRDRPLGASEAIERTSRLLLTRLEKICPASVDELGSH
jgi:tetratricopeptide (TPR) repeat protein